MWRLKVAFVPGGRRRPVLYNSTPAYAARQFDSLRIVGEFE